jgi:hypothetical protein
MSQSLSHPSAPSVSTPVPLPLRDLVAWGVFAAAFALVLLYLLGIEQGASSLVSGHYVHELVHDGRHLLGIPCH